MSKEKNEAKMTIGSKVYFGKERTSIEPNFINVEFYENDKMVFEVEISKNKKEGTKLHGITIYNYHTDEHFFGFASEESPEKKKFISKSKDGMEEIVIEIPQI